MLIGTVAFGAYGHVLGVRFDHQALRTQDVDVVHDAALLVVLDEVEKTDVERARGERDGFLAPPGARFQATSTSYRIRGKELRVGFLTPLRGEPTERPVYLPAYGVAAQPLRYLDYLVEASIRARRSLTRAGWRR